MLSKQCACNTGCSMFTIWIGCTQTEDKPRQKAPVTISHVSQESFLASYQKRCRQKLVSYKKEQLKRKSKFSRLLSKISEKKIAFNLQHLNIFNLAQKIFEKNFKSQPFHENLLIIVIFQIQRNKKIVFNYYIVTQSPINIYALQ